jgi:hypothetical protein
MARRTESSVIATYFRMIFDKNNKFHANRMKFEDFHPIRQKFKKKEFNLSGSLIGGLPVLKKRFKKLMNAQERFKDARV